MRQSIINKLNSNNMSKKVIEQIKVVKYFGKGEKEPTVIDNPSAIELTTVAKAICPEYQKAIDHNKFLEFENARLTKMYQKAVNKTHEVNDQNAKLVEALEEAKDINFDILCLLKRAIYFIDMTVAGYSSNLKQEIIKALQNNKKIEG